MPLLTSFGFKKPQNSERNFWDALNENTQKINDHTHNGTDSNKLALKDMSRLTSTIAPASWVAIDGQPGHFKADIIFPAGIAYSNNNVNPQFSIADKAVYLSAERKSDIEMTVFINSNAHAVKIVYA